MEVGSDSADVYGAGSVLRAFFNLCVDLGVTQTVELFAWRRLGVLTGPEEGGVTLGTVS